MTNDDDNVEKEKQIKKLIFVSLTLTYLKKKKINNKYI